MTERGECYPVYCRCGKLTSVILGVVAFIGGYLILFPTG
jgi:hypothetical protein